MVIILPFVDFLNEKVQNEINYDKILLLITNEIERSQNINEWQLDCILK